jgi:dCTP diphosphatase
MSATLAELRMAMAEFVAERDWAQYHAPKDVAAALSIEAAELQELFLWRERDDRADDRRQDVEDEVADVLMCLLNFCNVLDIDLERAFRKKLVAAAQKYPADRVRGRREKYDQYPEHVEDEW